MIHIESLENLEQFLELELSSYESIPIITHPGIRISRVCDNIIQLIKGGDKEAIKIGCLIIAGDPHLPFGKLIKSGIARALKQRIELVSVSERSGLIAKTLQLLNLQFCPRETEDYCKVVRKFGPAAIQIVLESAYAKNEKSKQLLAYLRASFLSQEVAHLRS